MTKIEELCNNLGIKIECVYGINGPLPDCWKRGECHPWTVTLSWAYKPFDDDGGSRTLTVPFFQGLAHKEAPTVHDVLGCLLTDVMTVENCESFEDWAGDLGFDADSRNAEKSYNACVESCPKLYEFLGEYIEEFKEAAMDY